MIDALRPLGVTEIDMPLTPMRVWQAIQAAKARWPRHDHRLGGSTTIAPRVASRTRSASLADGGEDAKLLAGGHSLLPLMKLRLAAPTLLVDLRRVPGLRGVQRENGGWRIGAMTRHADLAGPPELGVVARAASTDRRPAGAQPRHDRRLAGPRRPGVGPAGGAARARGRVTARGPAARATIAAADLFQDYLTTSLAHDEVITEVRLPALDGWASATRSSPAAPRTGRWSASARSSSRAGDGTCEDVRIGLTHMGSTPLRATAAEDALRGEPLDAERDRARRPSRPPRAPTRPATSTPRPTTSATWRGC